MAERVAFFLLSGPEMPCRMIHAFIWAIDVQQRGGVAKIVLEGEAPRWLLELPDSEHGRHGLYEKVKNAGLIDAVCKACRPLHRFPLRRAPNWSSKPPTN